ncbi:hypothetical protein AW27_024915 [Streptomyces sp. PCS3-D2]|uniref:hypothetical protein n=1 Tax=Streptomyces sp. PCS3-D2 TaxID=1460244 RepID=UPI000B0887C0|nr:hypothetical protein [Streptomyces sp. PCS3-D2]WKV74469.1 hypothetical protein AW27_024915 [Streptomyces sp. PCS3-D2]
MDVPDWMRWTSCAFAAVQLIFTYRSVQLLRQAGPGRRTDPWLAVADDVMGVVLPVGLALGSLDVLLVAGPVLLAIGACKEIRALLARRAARTAPAAGGGAVPTGD